MQELNSNLQDPVKMLLHLSEGIIDKFKKIPIDFGQGNLRHVTAGKRILLKLVRPGDNKKALEVGCRDGFYSNLLKKEGYVVISVDIVKRYDKVILVDINDGLPFKNDSFELVWCSEVIEHLNDAKHAIIEFRRVVRPQGDILLTTPNSFFWFFKIATIFGFPPSRLQRSDHKHFFSNEDIVRLFPSGKIFGFFPYFFFKFKINKCIEWLSPTFIIHEKNNK